MKKFIIKQKFKIISIVVLIILIYYLHDKEGQTFAQIFLNRTQKEQDDITRKHYKSIYKFEIHQKVRIIGTNVYGNIYYRANETWYIIPIIYDEPVYRITYMDKSGIIHKEKFTESQLTK